MGTELRRLKPETITRALVALRAELVRDGGPGLEHVEALLQLRGHNLGPVPRKAKPPNFRVVSQFEIYEVFQTKGP